MSKICTSLEQSNKLIELGIDPKTADIFCADVFDKEKETHSYNFHILSTWGCNTFEELKDRENKFVHFIPAWSLSALLELVPNGEKNDENYVDTESHSDFYICTYRNCWDGCIHSEYSEENLFDAVFGMICWLKENKKI